MWTRPLLLLVSSTLSLLAATAVTAAETQSDNQDLGCGEPSQIQGYEIAFRGNRILLPRYVLIERDGDLIYKDDELHNWQSPNMWVTYTTIDKNLLILTHQTDCVDLYSARLFILRGDGTVVQQDVWTSYWKDGFLLKEGRLQYWSEWFCMKEDPEKKAGMSYVYSFSEKLGAFEKIDVPEDGYCKGQIEKLFIKFQKANVVGNGNPQD